MEGTAANSAATYAHEAGQWWMAAAAESKDLVRVEAQRRLVPDLFGSRRRRRRIAELEFDLRSRDLAQRSVGGFGGWSVLSGGFIDRATFTLEQTLEDIGAAPRSTPTPVFHEVGSARSSGA